ncbi:hypothetical protein [Ancylobacter sp.]
MSGAPREAAEALTTEHNLGEYAVDRSGYLLKDKQVVEEDWGAVL